MDEAMTTKTQPDAGRCSGFALRSDWYHADGKPLICAKCERPYSECERSRT